MAVCHEFWILKSKLKDLNSRLGGCRICALEIYFLNFLENKWRNKTEVTLSLILRFNLRLGGYSIWSASTSSTSQPQSNRKNLEDYSMSSKEGPEATRRMFWLLEVLEDAQPSTQAPISIKPFDHHHESTLGLIFFEWYDPFHIIMWPIGSWIST